MAEERVQRRLAAILAADVVGYSRLMGMDEEGTLSRLKALRNDVIDPKIAEYGGRIFKTTGDGILAEFPSAVDAVRHAIDVQRAIAARISDLPDNTRIAFRIGISLGDVMVDGDDLFGNGVNVAARMEGLAEAGGICISSNVQEHIGSTLDVDVEDLGEQSVKNIDRPVRCYRVHLERSGTAKTPLPLPDKPAVAVLPFQNLSGDPEQEYFADGLTEDIITALTLWRSFPVIARNSTFVFKSKTSDIRQVGQQLGARYIVEGSVRKANGRIRVTAQLVNSETGHHVWAERYDRKLSDFFELQDEIAEKIAAIIEPAVRQKELEVVTAKPPAILEAWEYWLRGYAYIYEQTPEANEKARDMLYRAIDLDPNYARAFTGLAYTFVCELRYWRPNDRDACLQSLLDFSRKAIELDGSDAEAHSMLARWFFFAGRVDEAIKEQRRAVELNPHRAFSNNVLGNLLAMAGHFDEAIPWIERAIQLNPLDPQIHLFMTHLALANLGAGHYERAIELAQDAARRKPDFIDPHVYLASALGYMDRAEEAGRAIQQFKDEVEGFVENHPLYVAKSKTVIIDGLRKAGLTETTAEQENVLSVPDKPSIAVLPFENMSGDPEQEYFADGISEDLITALSRIRQLFVIARNTMFTYKEQAVDVQALAKELGVRYILEGSVRKAGDRVRITAQLIDGETGKHLWAERYDRDLNDIFEIQDEITSAVAGAIEPEIARVEWERANKKSPEYLGAWDCYYRGMAHVSRRTSDDYVEARKVFERAISLDPNFGPAYEGMAITVWHGIMSEVPNSIIDDGLRAARKAVELDDKDAGAHTTLGRMYSLKRDYEAAIAEHEKAIQLNPSSAASHYNLSRVLTGTGRGEEAIEHSLSAIRLSPHDPNIGAFYSSLCFANLSLKHNDEAVRWGRRAIRSPLINWPAFAFLASALAHLGNIEEAQRVLGELEQRQPGMKITDLLQRFPSLSNNEFMNYLIEGLTKAGMPE